jgi:hypothetical protein
MPALPVLCSGCLWAGYRTDSAGCEVSFNSTVVCLFLLLLRFWFSVFSLLLLLDGLVCMVALWWVVFA